MSDQEVMSLKSAGILCRVASELGGTTVTDRLTYCTRRALK